MARVETSHEENERSAMVQGDRKGRKQRERERGREGLASKLEEKRGRAGKG